MISICMATYNGERYIKEQIDSILPQLEETDEIIISDDGSTDKTIEIVQSFSDPRVQIHFNSGKHGYVGNFENALRLSSGDMIFLSDQDDIWEPNKIEVCVKALQDADLIIHDAQLVDGQGKSLGKTYYSVMHHRTGFWSNLIETRYLGCCMAFNRRTLSYVLPFPTYRRGHDYWIGCAAAMKYKVKFIPDVLIKYRRHGHNASPSSEKSNNSIPKKVFKRVNMLYELLLRCTQRKDNYTQFGLK